MKTDIKPYCYAGAEIQGVPIVISVEAYNLLPEQLKDRYQALYTQDQVNEMLANDTQEVKPYEPYFGWCDVEGCDKESVNGGTCWKDSGYWSVCGDHSKNYREGKPLPQMKQRAIERENMRGEDGVLFS